MADTLSLQKQNTWWNEFALLLRLQYTDYRGNAPYIVLFGLIMPLGVYWVLQTYVTLGIGSEWLIAGNLVMSVCYGAMNFSMQRIAWMRLAGEIDYYGTMPIRKSTFVTVIFTLGLLSSLPGMVSNFLIGTFHMGLPFSSTSWAIPVILYASFSLTVLGAGIGSLVKSMPQLSLYFYVSYAVVTFLCPVMVPFSKLPLPLQISSYVLPPGQAAIAVTNVMQGNFGTEFWVMMALLTGWLILSGTIGLRKLDWRSD